MKLAAVLFIFYMTCHAMYMIVLPRSWLKLPRGLALRGHLEPGKISTEVTVRVFGALLIYVAIQSISSLTERTVSLEFVRPVVASFLMAALMITLGTDSAFRMLSQPERFLAETPEVAVDAQRFGFPRLLIVRVLGGGCLLIVVLGVWLAVRSIRQVVNL